MMEIIYSDGEQIRLPCKTAVAMGNFDGIHLGHQKLIEKLREYKEKNNNVKTCVWTFADHTQNVLRSKFYVPFITETDEKINILNEYDIDILILNDFNFIRNISSTDFMEDTLNGALQCEYIACGFDFRFGKDNMGTADYLKEYLDGRIQVDIIPPVVCGGEIISSSLIRSLIKIGDMERVNRLLGRPFSLNLTVIYGKQLGREIGIPTINQIFPDGHIIPAFGIYACTCQVDETLYKAVANVGVRPTVDGKFVNCETHIMDYSGNLYDKKIRINLYKKLRDEEKFESVEKLKERINADVRTAREYFAD